jgi:HPr kinase/phosphorylase
VNAARITAVELFEQQVERLELRWLAGRRGAAARVLEAVETVARRPSLAGYLNIIYPNKVQILGTEELAWLDGLDSRQRWETIQKIIDFRPLAVVISKSQSCPEDLRIAAEESDTPLWVSPRRGHELLNHLQYRLARTLAPRVTLHGVFMEIYSIGVLITGESGSGKSELALELVTRGHRLVADDVVELKHVAPQTLEGSCPPMLRDFLEVRGLGILDIRALFGETAVKRQKNLKLIVELVHPQEIGEVGLNRLDMVASNETLLDVTVPKVRIPVAAGRNLAVLVEVAVRNHILKSRGINPLDQFIRRQQAAINGES